MGLGFGVHSVVKEVRFLGLRKKTSDLRVQDAARRSFSSAFEALGPGHVTPDDEVGGTVILADDHVLDGLSKTSREGSKVLGLGTLVEATSSKQPEEERCMDYLHA